MKIYNPVASGKASGRALGGVFSFNRGMATFKRYVKPSNPNSPGQQEIKNRFSALTKYWANSLTYEQITLWNNWVLPWTDIYGNLVTLTGINKFCICNDVLKRAEKPLSLVPPTLTPSGITIVSTGPGHPGTIIITISEPAETEWTEQTPFFKIQINGGIISSHRGEHYAEIFAKGISISQTPLEKNYSTPYFYDEMTFDQQSDFYITPTLSTEQLFVIRFQRFNKFGFWSAPYIYTGTTWAEE